LLDDNNAYEFQLFKRGPLVTSKAPHPEFEHLK